MIIVAASDLWILLGIVLVTTVVAFMLGWSARDYFTPLPETGPPPPPARPAPPAPPRPPVARPGRLPVVIEPTAHDIGRWWTALEREVNPATAPMSRAEVEMTNWERNLTRRQRQWEHDHGIRDAAD